MVDLTRNTHARLLDLAPGRSGTAYAGWLGDRGETFRTNVKVAALDPFAGYKTAIDDKLEDAVAVLDAFHVVKLGTAAVDGVRRRVQQDTLGHRGRKGDPLHGIQTILRAGAENLTDKQQARLAAAIEADPAHDEVFVAWQCAQQLSAALPHEGSDRRAADRRGPRPLRHGTHPARLTPTVCPKRPESLRHECVYPAVRRTSSCRSKSRACRAGAMRRRHGRGLRVASRSPSGPRS